MTSGPVTSGAVTSGAVTSGAVTSGAMASAVIGLGANRGDAAKSVRDAVASLRADPRTEVVAVSDLWRTAPVGGPPQDDFHNAVVLVRTWHTPETLLALCRSIEDAAGRIRDVRWGPRTLDLDIIAFDGERRVDPELSLPHPRAHERAFVLLPWAQLEPDRLLEPLGLASRTVAQWASEVGDQQARAVAGQGWWQ